VSTEKVSTDKVSTGKVSTDKVSTDKVSTDKVSRVYRHSSTGEVFVDKMSCSPVSLFQLCLYRKKHSTSLFCQRISDEFKKFNVTVTCPNILDRKKLANGISIIMFSYRACKSLGRFGNEKRRQAWWTIQVSLKSHNWERTILNRTTSIFKLNLLFFINQA